MTKIVQGNADFQLQLRFTMEAVRVTILTLIHLNAKAHISILLVKILNVKIMPRNRIRALFALSTKKEECKSYEVISHLKTARS